jgi:hypothetical protein
MEIEDFANEYRSKTDEELLRLELVSEQLTPEANTALTAELSKRKINGNDELKSFRQKEERRQAEQAANPGRLFYMWSIGRARFGKARFTHDAETGKERFTTTVFTVVGFLPLIPTGTYLVERAQGSFSNPINFLEKLPLDWEQVLKVWVVAAGSLLALIWVFKLLPRLLYRP